MSTSPNVVLLWLFIALTSSTIIDDSATSNDISCNCDNCEGSKVVPIEENDSEIDDGTIEKNMYTEDFDGDGNSTICARDRDSQERTFPSICHMLCYNKCTRFRIWIYEVKKEKKYIVSAFRTDWYKLRDGPC